MKMQGESNKGVIRIGPFFQMENHDKLDTRRLNINLRAKGCSNIFISRVSQCLQMLYQNSLMPVFITEVPLHWLLKKSNGNLLSAPSSHATVRRNDVCFVLFTFLVGFQSRTLLFLCQGKDAKMDQKKPCAISFFSSFFTQLRGIFVGTNSREEKLNSKWLIARGS